MTRASKLAMDTKLILALFSAAILFAMVREWNAPSACLRLPIEDRTFSRTAR